MSARWLRLRVRPGTLLHTPERDFAEGDELVVAYAEAALLLRGKGGRGVEVVEDFEADDLPDGVVSLRRGSD